MPEQHETKAAVRIGIRQLVEFLLRTGSIDSRFTGFDRANEGARIHRRLQKAAGPGYAAEVAIKAERQAAGLTFLLEGRADGIFTDEDGAVVIDEIKTTTVPSEAITPGMQPVHWAQGQVYAAIWAAQEGLDAIKVRLTYYQVDEELTLRFTRSFTAAELDTFLQDLLVRYAPWAQRAADWGVLRGQSLAALAFPYPAWRAGQRAMAGAAYRAFEKGERLLCQAPTGIGKTMSVLFAALKAMGGGLGRRVFYLTARTTARQAAENALDRLRAADPGLRLKSITLTAKDKVCLCEVRECTPEHCPYANGYYDRIKTALADALDTADSYTRPALEALAKKHRICPFELGLDLSLWCDVIVGDYNYLFDPVVRLVRFFEGGRGEHLFLVDEAHNLPGRAREMYSASLEKSQIRTAKKALGRGKSKAKTALGRLDEAFALWREDCAEAPGQTLFFEPPQEEFNRLLSRAAAPLEEWLDAHRDSEAHGEVLETYFAIRSYLRVAEWYDERYVTQVSAFGRQRAREVRVQQLCLDPSAFVDASLALGRGAVLFSATLAPPGYYKDLLGCPDALAAALPSPFAAEHLGLYRAGELSTRYQDRAASLDRLAEYLHVMITAAGRPGNYLAFFPSYAYLEQAYARFCERWPELDTIVQRPGMAEGEREEFLARFAEHPARPLLGFAVLGGVFGEGVDLAGTRLVGVAVVGVGLPQVNPRQELLRDYFEKTRGSGFAYAYQYPGMNKVLQAAGRVIRTGSDKGVVLLLDERFCRGDYSALFPAHWAHCETVYSPDALSGRLAAFWAESESP